MQQKSILSQMDSQPLC